MAEPVAGKDICRGVLDAIHYKVWQEGAIVNKGAYMVIGIDLDGRKDVLGMWIGEHETSKFWLVVLSELRNRGIQDILICCVDNLRGFSEAIAACYQKMLYLATMDVLRKWTGRVQNWGQILII